MPASSKHDDPAAAGGAPARRPRIVYFSVREGKAPSSYYALFDALERRHRQLEVHRRRRELALRCLRELSLSEATAMATATARSRAAALRPALHGAAARAPPGVEGGGQFGALMTLMRALAAPAGVDRDHNATAAPPSTAATTAARAPEDEGGGELAALMARLKTFVAQAGADHDHTAAAAPPSAAAATPADGLGEMLDKMALSGED